eukprot:6546099-Heterocapsa_arctica.AAC.2
MAGRPPQRPAHHRPLPGAGAPQPVGAQHPLGAAERRAGHRARLLQQASVAQEPRPHHPMQPGGERRSRAPGARLGREHARLRRRRASAALAVAHCPRGRRHRTRWRAAQRPIHGAWAGRGGRPAGRLSE